MWDVAGSSAATRTAQRIDASLLGSGSQVRVMTTSSCSRSGTSTILFSSSVSIASDLLFCKKARKTTLAKRPRSDAQNGPRQPECCTAPAQKIWCCYCRPDCVAQNASLQVQQHNSNPSFLTAVVTAPCVARQPPTNQLDK